MKTKSFVRLFSTLALATCFTVACGLPTVTQTAEPPLSPVQPPTVAVTPAQKGIQIVIDGDPSDWEVYGALLNDPRGDHKRGGFDIAAVRAFANDAFLYVLVETHEAAADFVQLDLDVRSGGRSFVISFWPGSNQPAFIGEMTSGVWKEVGEVAGSASALGKAVEVKIPLFYFEDVSNLELTNVRPMNGVCCGEDWYAIDEIQPVKIPQLGETEPEVALAELPPRICAEKNAPPLPFGSMKPAPIRFAEMGYVAEWFVAPGPFNMPQEILLSPQGDILVYAVRGHTLSKLADDGTITLIADEVYGYLGDVDAEGSVYLHMHPDGRITRVSPEGDKQIIVQSSQLRTDCDSGFGFGPDGNLYVAVSRCKDKSDLYRVTLAGQIAYVTEVPQLQVIRTAPDGRFLAASYDEVYEISLDDFTLTSIGKIPGRGISPGGLAVDDTGRIYVSTGNRSTSGGIYRMDAGGKFTLLAEIPENGLSGIEWLPQTGEVVGGQLRQGGVIGVSPDGTLREIVSGNGIITPMAMAFSPCGEMALPNDDGGMLTLVDPSGAVSWFMDYLSFIPPDPYVAFAPDGTLYASEAAPGLFPVRVGVRTPLNPSLQTLIEANYPSGLAYRSDGVLFVSETSAGRILAVRQDGASSVYAEGLHFPTALALDLEGNLYVVVAPDGLQLPADHPPTNGDKIVQVKPDGSQKTFARLTNVRAIAFGPDSNLYATTGNALHRISLEDGKTTRLAEGFEDSVGLAFDLAGNLHVSDEHANGIVRINGFPQGRLSGAVTDVAGVSIEGARVQVTSVDPIVVGQVVFTDAQGRFSLLAAPRKYSVIVSKEGYQTLRQENIITQPDQETSLDSMLQVNP
jgi:sugar lactone lactonase YvrE